LHKGIQKLRNLQKGIRQKRFHVRKDRKVYLEVETSLGERIKFAIEDASITALRGYIVEGELCEESSFEGCVLPESRLSWGSESLTLGKLHLKRIKTEGEVTEVVFTCVENKVPLSGSLTKYFYLLEDGAESPFDFEISYGKFSLASFSEAQFAHPDLFEKCRQYDFFLKEFRKNPLFQYYSVKKEPNGSRAKFTLSGSNFTVDCVSFAGYDYLGFSRHPEVKEAAIKAIERYGMGAEGSPVLSGKTKIHEELEAAVARTFRKEDAVLFNSGFSANIGALTGLLSANDFVLADVFSHASIHDAIAASNAKFRMFKHNNIQHLNSILKECRDEENGTLIVTEGLFSMEGTVPDLVSIVESAKAKNARLYLDECHSIGVMGESGLGAAERFGVLDKIDVFMGVFGKGLGGGCGGFIAGNREMVNWLRFFARSGMFSVAMPPGIAAASLKALELMLREPERRVKLQRNITRFRDGLRKLGITPISDEQSPIIPVIVSDESRMGLMNQKLLSRGIYVNCVLFPAVPVGKSRFRFSLTAEHSDSDIDLALFALEEAFQLEEKLGKSA
jgi:8-amino-7-oxononanoate synthase